MRKRKTWYRAKYDDGKIKDILAEDISDAVEKARNGISPVIHVYQI